MRELAKAHFEAGPLLARHVKAPTSAGDALAQAMFSWLKRNKPRCKRLTFGFALLDHDAAQQQVSEYGMEDNLTSELFLGIELPEENVFEIGPSVERLQKVHPGLPCTLMPLISQASAKSVFIRTPEYFLDLFARWWWEWDWSSSDEDAREHLKGMHEMADEDLEHYLPSKVKPLIAPEYCYPHMWAGKRRSGDVRPLRPHEVRRIAATSGRWVQRVCSSMLELDAAIRRGKYSEAFTAAVWAEPAYAAASIGFFRDEWISELLDDHFNYINSSGEGTYFQSLLPLTADPEKVPEQYQDLLYMFDIVRALDRLLVAVTTT